MRWLLALIALLLAVFYLMPEPPPTPVEETFIGEPVKALQKAQGFEQDYLKATEERQRQMEEELEAQAGGG